MIDPRLARLRDEVIRLRRRPDRPIPEDVDDAFRLMLADIRDAITTVIGADEEIADDDFVQIVNAMLYAEKQYLRKVAGLDDEELDRAASRALRRHALH